MARIDAFLKLGRDQGASDIHIAVGSPPLIRMHGELSEIKYRALTADEMEDLIKEIIPENLLQRFKDGYDLDFSYESAEAGRYRANLYRKITGFGGAFRVISPTIPTMDELGLPESVQKMLHAHQGLILVTGATGTGKSTTLAAMIDWINKNRKFNIITLEDPIEYIHTSQQSLVIQRSVGTHVKSFADGLHAALREDPDVILVGELRDPETINMAMTATETGHLVLGTLHTTTAVKTIDRIIDAMPAEQKMLAATFLAQHLKGVICQKLLRSSDGKSRKAMLEIMVNTSGIGNLILNRKNFQIPSILQTGREQGMQLMDQALLEAVKNKEIDPDDAYVNATDKKLFQRFVTNPDLLPQVNLVIG
ncbi:MAG: PilT/PilU family type 4a pilus ATPase [Gammaproteobacteria bacterium]|nr:PilT/PilU family type 4a pilus ATPase [Gammaproteobacteria bacterium]